MAANPWTPVQEELARVFYRSPLTDEEFLAKVGRSRCSYKSRLRYLKLGRREGEGRHFAERTFARPTPAMLADAQKRLALRTPIRDILGDPAPGYSALDTRVDHVTRPDASDRVVSRIQDPHLLNRISTATLARRSLRRTEEAEV